MGTWKSSSEDVAKRSSSRPGKLEPPLLLLDNQEVEKIEEAKGLDNPWAGRVRDPDLRRLLRSVMADEAADDAMDAE